MSTASPQPESIVGLERASRRIAATLSTLPSDRPVVGITGPVGSGKSTLAGRLAKQVVGLVLSTDRYLPNYAETPPDRRDEPGFSDLARLGSDLQTLQECGEASVPVWSFHEHRRTGEERVRVGGPILCEGLMALHASVSRSLDLAVFVQASRATRWSRWEAIENAGERGWGVEAAREHFEDVAEPTFARFANDYLSAADVIVWNDESGASSGR